MDENTQPVYNVRRGFSPDDCLWAGWRLFWRYPGLFLATGILLMFVTGSCSTNANKPQSATLQLPAGRMPISPDPPLPSQPPPDGFAVKVNGQWWSPNCNGVHDDGFHVNATGIHWCASGKTENGDDWFRVFNLKFPDFLQTFVPSSPDDCYVVKTSGFYKGVWRESNGHKWNSDSVWMLPTFSGDFLNLKLPGFLAPFFLVGMYWMILGAVRGREPKAMDFFVAFTKLRWFVGIFVLDIFIGLLVGLGCVALVVPGIYFVVAFTFANIAMIDRDLGVWEAVKFSCKRIHPYWWQMLWLHILTFLALILGVLFCGVGVLVAYPIIFIAIVYAYDVICCGGYAPCAKRSERLGRRTVNERLIQSLHEVSRGTRTVNEHLQMVTAMEAGIDPAIEPPRTDDMEKKENRPLLIALAALILTCVAIANIPSIYSVPPRIDSPAEWMGEITSAYPDFRLVATRESGDRFTAIFADSQNRLVICHFNTATRESGLGGLSFDIQDSDGKSLIDSKRGGVGAVNLQYTRRTGFFIASGAWSSNEIYGRAWPLPEGFEGEVFIRFYQRHADPEVIEMAWPPKEFLPTPQKSAAARLTPWRAKASPWR